MPCRTAYEKLWNNYLAKYGDFHERLQMIQNDSLCSILNSKQKTSNNVIRLTPSVKKARVIDSNKKFRKKCDPLLPSECCHSNFQSTLNQHDLDELEKLIQDENFPDNIFPVDISPRFSMDNVTDLSVINNTSDNIHRVPSHRFISSINSIISSNDISHSITQSAEESTRYPRSKSIPKSEMSVVPQHTSNSHVPTTNSITNPYAKLIERLRREEKTKLNNTDIMIDHQSPPTIIDSNTHIHIQKLLSFLHSLDDPTNNQQPSDTIDENILINLFSVDHHLTSSMYIPINLQQLNILPKSILRSMKNTSDDEQILNKIQTEISSNQKKEVNIKSRLNHTKQQQHSTDDSQILNFVEQDNELNSRLNNTFTIKVFKEYLINNNKSTRLPKLFHDIDQQISKI